MKIEQEHVEVIVNRQFLQVMIDKCDVRLRELKAERDTFVGRCSSYDFEKAKCEGAIDEILSLRGWLWIELCAEKPHGLQLIGFEHCPICGADRRSYFVGRNHQNGLNHEIADYQCGYEVSIDPCFGASQKVIRFCSESVENKDFLAAKKCLADAVFGAIDSVVSVDPDLKREVRDHLVLAIERQGLPRKGNSDARE